MSTKKPPSFGRSGRPRKIDLSDLFLWDPTIEQELSGLSATELFGGIDSEMLALHQDIRRKRNIGIDRAREVLSCLIDSTSFPLADEYHKALHGEENRVTSLGVWESYIYGLHFKPNDCWPPEVTPLGSHFIDIERELKEPTLAWQQKDMARCTELLEGSQVLAPYLWPEVISKLRCATTVEEVTSARLMVMLELFLSSIAAWDAKVQADGFANESVFCSLFPDLSSGKISHPNAILFDWLETYTSNQRKLAHRIHQISKPAADTDIGSTKRQLRRWKSGAGFPTSDVWDALFRNLYGDKADDKDDPKNKDWVLSWSKAMGTKRINFLMPLLAPLSRIHGPHFPFGHETLQEWRHDRYRHWYKDWLTRLGGRPQE